MVISTFIIIHISVTIIINFIIIIFYSNQLYMNLIDKKI